MVIPREMLISIAFILRKGNNPLCGFQAPASSPLRCWVASASCHGLPKHFKPCVGCSSLLTIASGRNCRKRRDLRTGSLFMTSEFVEVKSISLLGHPLNSGYPRVGLLRWSSDKESACYCRKPRFYLQVGKIPWRRKRQPIPVFLPGKSCGQRRLAGYDPQGHRVRHN